MFRRLYRVYWYVPSQKRYVKSVEEVYDTNGVRTSRYTQEQNTSKLAS
jgi:IS4 transposase